ncbi:MAG: GNAT family N-acetyltransferase [Saprospiraceae bacterium]|nr:GNAT family N-acetyltransferase [Saprospiraceae bacterium]
MKEIFDDIRRLYIFRESCHELKEYIDFFPKPARSCRSPLYLLMVLNSEKPDVDLRIRNAKPDEYNAIGKLMVRVYSLLEGFPSPEEQPEYYKMLANIGDLTLTPDTELLVAVSADDKIAGGLVYFKDMKYYGSGGSATREVNAAGFRLLAVDPAYQGQGIGKKLVKECINKSRSQGLNQLILHTTQSMKTAWKMYENLGFKPSEDLDFERPNLKVYGFRLILSTFVSEATTETG